MSKGSLLLVEDEINCARTLKRVVEKLGYTVTGIVMEGDKVLQKIREHNPDMVLIDIELGGSQDGIEISRQIRSQFQIPFIYVTGHSEDELLERAKTSEPVGYILKPFGIQELKSQLEFAFYKKKEEEEMRLYRKKLEGMVEGRTLELKLTNEKLRQEIMERKAVEETLRRKANSDAMLAEISAALINPADLAKTIQKIMMNVGRTMGVDRVFLLLFHPGKNLCNYVQEWCAQGIASTKERLPGMELSLISEIMAGSILYKPIQVGREFQGVFGFENMKETRKWQTEDSYIIHTLANLIGSAISGRRYEEALEKKSEQLRDLGAHMENVREDERKRISMIVHDELGQAFTALKYDLSWLQKHLYKEEDLLKEKIVSMKDLIDSSIGTVKKIITDLRPSLLDELGLAEAIEWLAHEFRQRTGIECLVSLDTTSVESGTSTTLFRILQEALTNAARHSKASKVGINLKEKKSRIELKVSDNGIGIKEEHILSPVSYGIIGMKERVDFLGGKIELKSGENRGTTLKIILPLGNGRDKRNESAHY